MTGLKTIPQLRACCRVCVMVALCAMLLSCAVVNPADVWIEPRPLATGSPTYRPPRMTVDNADAEPPSPTRDPVGELTLRDALALALMHSPQLESYAWNVRAYEAKTIQAGLSPNPRVSVSAENLGPSGDDRFLSETVRLSQVIELGDKRDKRVRVASAQRRLAAWDYEQQRLDVLTTTAQRFIEVVIAQQRVALAERTLKLVEQVYEIVDQTVKAGVVAPAERDKAAVRVSIERIALDGARHKLDAARYALVATWGGSSPCFDRAAGDLKPIDAGGGGAGGAVPPKQELLTRASNHPRLARWDDEIEYRRRAVELARANAVQDVTAGAGVRHFPDADDAAAVIELSVPLPLTDRNQGRILEARYRLAQTIANQRAATASLHAQVATAHARFAAAAFALSTLESKTLPAARAAFQAAKDSFENGKSDYLDTLDAERLLLEVERQSIDARSTYHNTLATLEGLTGSPLTGTNKQP